MKKVIYDCDNTMGISNRDIDDGLALLYLINNPDVELLGVTCTYGNDRLDRVYEQTVELMKEIGSDIPVYKGRGGYVMEDYYGGIYKNNTTDDFEDIRNNEAAQFIISIINKYPGEVNLLATGSMQNLYDAGEIDPCIIPRVNKIVLMGGITEKLKFGEKIMNELNFSVCPKGAFNVITRGTDVSILTGNNCLNVQFTEKEFEELKKKSFEDELKNTFLIEKIDKWMKEFKAEYNYSSIVLWDVIAAIYLTNPELFEDRHVRIKSKEQDFITGHINIIGEFKENITLTREDVQRIVDRDENVDLNDGRNVINLPSAKSPAEINKKMIEIVHR